MVLTVTLNPAIDKILILNHFELHKLHRLEANEISFSSPGGKGVNIAHNLKLLGNDVIASGFAGGNSGHLLCDALRKEGIATNFVFTNSKTRTNISILDKKNETLTEINDFGGEVSKEDVDFFFENFERLLNRVKIVVVAGSLPQAISTDVFGRLIKIARSRGIKTIAHTLPDYTEEILKESPFLIVPDMRSKHELFGEKVDGIAEFMEIGNTILKRSPKTEFVIFTHRIENVVAITHQGAYIVRPKNLKIANMLGYGDAWLAGFIHGYLKGFTIEETLRFASACGLTDVEDLYKEIRDTSKIQQNLDRIHVEAIK